MKALLYVLQYKLYVAQEVSLEERIEVLEELKKRDYREKWAYELAYLYHRVGLATRCVEECDELILWFGEGKYVRKAMELKMLHEPLTPKQQALYNGEVAYEMARGIITKDYNDFAISTTGYAEQFGEKDNAGLVYIGIGDKTRVEVYGYKFIGDREKVRKLTTNAAIFHLIKKIKGSFDYVG